MSMVASPVDPGENRGFGRFAFQGSEVRSLILNGEPWWVATDVTKILGYRSASDATRLLDDDEKGTHSVRTPGGDQVVAIVNEPGLYSLILRSKLPQAKAFKRWITHEVIPAIRKTGRFEVVPLGDPLAELERQTDVTRRAIELAKAERARAVKAEAFQVAIEAGDGLTLRAFHKKYFSGLGEKEFMTHLYDRGYLIDQRGKGGERADGTVRDGSQHRHPSAKGKPFFYLHGHGQYGGKRREATRVLPGQPELELKARLIRDGLVANNNDTGKPLEIEGRARPALGAGA